MVDPVDIYSFHGFINQHHWKAQGPFFIPGPAPHHLSGSNMLPTWLHGFQICIWQTWRKASRVYIIKQGCGSRCSETTNVALNMCHQIWQAMYKGWQFNLSTIIRTIKNEGL